MDRGVGYSSTSGGFTELEPLLTASSLGVPGVANLP